MRSLAVILALFSASLQASVDKVTSSTLQPLHTPSAAMAPEALLDVGIPPFNDGLELTDEDDTVFPEVRYAESMYFRQPACQDHGKKRGLGRHSGDA